MSDSVTAPEFQYSIGEDEFLSTAIVRATGALTGQSVLELPPLEESVSADAVDELYESMKRRGTAHGRFLSISYCGVTVEVGEDETIYLFDEQICG